VCSYLDINYTNFLDTRKGRTDKALIGEIIGVNGAHVINEVNGAYVIYELCINICSSIVHVFHIVLSEIFVDC